MIVKHTSCITLLLCLLFTLIAKSSARAIVDMETFISTPIDNRFSGEYIGNYISRTVAPREFLLNRLRRGYYFINEGEITPVSPTDISQNIRRRQDSAVSYNSNQSKQNDARYAPLVRYHQTHTKHKKLFVPNLFG